MPLHTWGTFRGEQGAPTNLGISRGERGYLKLGVTCKGKQGIYVGALLEVSKEHTYCTIGVIPVVSKGYN